MKTDGNELKEGTGAAGRPVRVGLVLLAAVLVSAPAFAVLGEELESLRKRFGRPSPELKPQKNVSTWFIETEAGERVMYTVTFGADGRSIAEGLKPVGRALLKPELVREFVDEQREQFLDSKTVRIVKPGEKYAFAGRALTCGAHEQVIVDEPGDYLIVTIGGETPSVLAVRAEMLQPAK